MLPIVTISRAREQPSTAAAATESAPYRLHIVGADSANPDAVKLHRLQVAA